LPAKAAFASVERELEDIATLMAPARCGSSGMFHSTLARRGIVSGLLLAFARSIGEFGATVDDPRHITGRQTLPISIYSDYTSGRSLESFSTTWLAMIVLSAIFASELC